MRVCTSKGSGTRSIRSPHLRCCSPALTPAYSGMLDHFQQSHRPWGAGLRCGFFTDPGVPGLNRHKDTLVVQKGPAQTRHRENLRARPAACKAEEPRTLYSRSALRSCIAIPQILVFLANISRPIWGDRSRPFKTSHGLNLREALWIAVAAATVFSESKCITGKGRGASGKR